MMLFPTTKRSQTAALTVVAFVTVATAADSTSIATGLSSACQSAVVSLLGSDFCRTRTITSRRGKHAAQQFRRPSSAVVMQQAFANKSRKPSTTLTCGLIVCLQGTCASLTGLVAVATTSGSIINPVNTWLENVCTKTCNSTTLVNAQKTVSTGCATDISSGVTTAVALQAAIASYPTFRSAACIESTSNSTLCLTQLLTEIQAVSGNLTITEVLSLTSNLTSIESLPTAEACSDCNKALFTTLEPVITNASGTESSELKAGLSSKCGATFVNGMMPSSVSTTAGNTTTGSAATANGTTSTTSTSLSAGKGLRLTLTELLVAVVALGLGTAALA